MSFNYGSIQLSIVGGPTITLENCDFNPDSKLFGYNRSLSEDFLPSIEYNIYGNATIRQSYNDVGKFRFEMDLQLDSAKLTALAIVYRLQRSRLANSLADSIIIMNDTRLAIAEPTGSFSRPIAPGGTLPDVALPAGYEWYYPQFNVVIQGDTINTAEQFMLKQGSDWLYKFTLELLEV